MQRKPEPERALSDSVSITLILLLVVAAAVIVFIVVFGYGNLAPKSAYIAMRGMAANTSVGAATLTVFHFEGDPVNLNASLKGGGVAPVRFSLNLPQGATEPVSTSPFITENTWSSGNTISIYEDAAGYWVTDDINGRIARISTLGPLVSMPGGNYTIDVIDKKANVLIGKVPVTIAGIGSTGPQYSPGLIATYYSDQGWTTAAATNIAQRVYFADTASGRASDITDWPMGLLGKADHFSVKYSGFVKVETEDDYTFTLSSDDGSYMDLDGTSNFISNGGDHSYASVSATKHLLPGYHPVTVRMYENGGAAVVYLEYKTPAMTSSQVVTQLYHIPSTPPVADFTAIPRAGPVPLLVQFNDASSDAASWSWNFGDGSSLSHAKNPSHTYTTAGKYGVTLVATNSYGSNTAQKSSYITAGAFTPGLLASYYRGQSWSDLAGTRIDAQIDFTDQGSTWPISLVGRQDDFSVMWDGYISVPAESDYSFSLTSDDGSFLWVDETQLINNGGDHSSTTVTQSKHLTAGFHHVVVKMYENGGVAVARLTSTPSVTFYHIPSTSPVADFTAVPRAGPAPLIVQFNDASSDATSWSWDFGDGSPVSVAQSPAHSYTAAGTYGVRLVAGNSFGSSTAQKNNYITVGSFVPGFLASYYRGQSWSDLAGTRTDAQIEFTDQATTWPEPVGRQDNFSVNWDGYINVPTDADYSFRLTSDDGSWLWVDETQLIDNGGDHSSQAKFGTVHLGAGYHHIVVRMYENGGAAVADLDYAILPSTTYTPVTNVYHMP